MVHHLYGMISVFTAGVNGFIRVSEIALFPAIHSRPAGGVILIETKRGRGETQINYRGSLGASAVLNRESMLNTQKHGEALWRAAINDGLDPSEITQIYSFAWHRDTTGRPAGGVMLMETKSGRGETQINYRRSLGASAFLNRENMLNTQ